MRVPRAQAGFQSAATSDAAGPLSAAGDRRDARCGEFAELPFYSNLVPRARLLDSVIGLRGGGVVFLTAGPGYGKSALMSQIAGEFDGPCYYCSFAEDREKGEAMVSGLLSGLRRFPESKDQLRLDLAPHLLDPLPSRDGDGEPVLVLLDDVDEVFRSARAQGFGQALQELVDGMPGRWLAVIASRSRLPISAKRAALQGRLAVLGHRDLRLTPKEVALWAEYNLGVRVRREDTRALWRLTEGWPIALALSAGLLKRPGDHLDHAAVERLLARGRDLKGYLELNVMEGLDVEARQVLAECYPLPRVSFPIDDTYFGAEAVQARAQLERLSIQGHLVQKSGGRVFRVHPLIREYCRDEKARSDPAEYRRITLHGARHLEDAGDWERAVSLYLSVDATEEAKRVMRAVAASFLNASDSVRRPEWLCRLPESFLQQDPSLLLMKARILQGQGLFEEGAVVYRKAARRTGRGAKAEGAFQALSGEAFCLYMLGRWEDCLAALRRAEAAAKTPEERTEALCTTGNVLLGQCRWDDAVEKWETALAVAPADAKPAYEARVCAYRTRLFFLRGNYGAAVDWARRTVKGASAKVDPSYAIALNVCATAAYFTGSYAEAALRAEAALALVRARGWAFLEAPVLLTLAGVAQGNGDYRTAHSHLGRAKAISERTRDIEALVWCEHMLGDLCRVNRNMGKAEQHHRRALELSDEHQLAVFEKTRAQSGLAADLANQGREDEAAACLEGAVALSRKFGLAGTLSLALLYDGWLAARAGREQAAARILGEAMEVAASGRHAHCLLQEAAVAIPIMALCDRLGHGDFLRLEIIPRLNQRQQRYFTELAEGRTYPTDVGLGRPSDSRFKEARTPRTAELLLEPEVLARFAGLTVRELEILRLIGLGMPNKVIASRLFITEKTVKTHTNRMYKKLGVLNRLQAVLAFQRYQRHRAAERPER